MAGLDIGGSLASVLFRSQSIGGGGILRFGEESLQVAHTPAAPRSCSAAFAELAGAARVIHADEVDDLPLGDVEAVANRIVEFHNQIPSKRDHRVSRPGLLHRHSGDLAGSNTKAVVFHDILPAGRVQQHFQDAANSRIFQVDRDRAIEVLLAKLVGGISNWRAK
jgi:hypothetical protein